MLCLYWFMFIWPKFIAVHIVCNNENRQNEISVSFFAFCSERKSEYEKANKSSTKLSGYIDFSAMKIDLNEIIQWSEYTHHVLYAKCAHTNTHTHTRSHHHIIISISLCNVNRNFLSKKKKTAKFWLHLSIHDVVFIAQSIKQKQKPQHLVHKLKRKKAAKEEEEEEKNAHTHTIKWEIALLQMVGC